MYDKNNKGRKIEGYEAKKMKVETRLEPYEYEELANAMRMSGDTKSQALRTGIRLYVAAVKDRIRERG